MIVKEFYKTREDGVGLYRTYSDENYKIKQKETGKVFDEAIDVETTNYSYEETNERINEEMDEKEVELKAQAYDIIIGEVE